MPHSKPKPQQDIEKYEKQGQAIGRSGCFISLVLLVLGLLIISLSADSDMSMAVGLIMMLAALGIAFISHIFKELRSSGYSFGKGILIFLLSITLAALSLYLDSLRA